jgi:hypothetical protein
VALWCSQRGGHLVGDLAGELAGGLEVVAEALLRCRDIDRGDDVPMESVDGGRNSDESRLEFLVDRGVADAPDLLDMRKP